MYLHDDLCRLKYDPAVRRNIYQSTSPTQAYSWQNPSRASSICASVSRKGMATTIRSIASGRTSYAQQQMVYNGRRFDGQYLTQKLTILAKVCSVRVSVVNKQSPSRLPSRAHEKVFRASKVHDKLFQRLRLRTRHLRNSPSTNLNGLGICTENLPGQSRRIRSASSQLLGTRECKLLYIEMLVHPKFSGTYLMRSKQSIISSH